MSGRAETGVRMSLCVCVCVCVCVVVVVVVLVEMYANVVFVIRCLYSAVSLTLVKE